MANGSSAILERFWTKVSPLASGCWVWRGCLGQGYGLFYLSSRLVRAHRFSFELATGCPIPDGLTLDHLCRNRGCVNPSHLEPVTNGENVRRGVGPTAMNAKKTHCKYGHEFTPENTVRVRLGRQCRVCIRRHDSVGGKRRRIESKQRKAA